MRTLKNKLIKFAVLLMALVMAAPVFTGCMTPDDDVVPEGATVIYLHMWESGYGIDWMEQIVKNYNEKETGVYVKMDSSALRDKATLPAVAKTDYDVFIADNSGFYKESLVSNFKGYDSTYIEITDVVKSKYGEEDKTLEEKMVADIRDFANVDGKYYFLPLINNNWGLTYNVELMEDYDLPKTTEEFFSLLEDMKDDDSIESPIIFSGDTDYWDPVLWTWWAQYDGIDSYEAFYRGEDVNGKQTADIFANRGRLLALQTLERVLTPSNGYCDENSTGYQYMQAQVKYLSGSSAFMANGGWLEKEMEETFAGNEHSTIDVLETPVISSIVEKLSFYTDGEYENLSPSAVKTYDEKLVQIIDYVDGGMQGNKPSFATNEDIAIVKEARDVFYLDGQTFGAAIPCYTDNADEAKDFVKYLYSDEVAKLICDFNVGGMLPISHDFLTEDDIADLPQMTKSMIGILERKQMITTQLNSKMVYDGGLTDFRMPGTMEVLFGSVNDADRKTANEVFMFDYEYYHTGNAWKNLLAAGAPIVG